MTFNWQLAFNEGGGGGLQFSGYKANSAFGVLTSNKMPVDRWVHLVGTYENGSYVLYEDGVVIGQKTSDVFSVDTNVPMTIGNSGGFEPFLGYLDDVRIYQGR